MWGLILFDTTRNMVVICRDRMGIKPLYTWQRQGIIAIASEIKQFIYMPGFAPRLAFSVAVEYLRMGQDKWLCGPMRPLLENWLRQDRPLWELVERADVERLANQTWQLQGKREKSGQALFRLFVFDRWMEIFGITC